MSQALELLNSLSETVVDHKHVVPDSDTYFLIDPYTRQIENTNYQKAVLMRGDHNSERFTFEVPRYVDGHDMSLCNRVIVHFDNVGDSIENVYSDVAYMDDLRINPDKPETVISSWLIRREATQIVGLLSFSIQYQCVEGEEITYEWNTDSYDDIEIRKSKNNGEAAVINYTNVLEQWRSQIFGAGDSVMSNITTEGANQVAAVQTESATQQAAIELKGSETLATIPDDYTEVYNMASEAVRTKADGVVCEAEGEAITVADASDDYIRGLNVYGKTTQVTTTGKNLIPILATSRTSNGITYDVYEDGHIRVHGTATANSWLWGGLQNGDDRLAYIPAGTYTLSGNPNKSIAGYVNGWYVDGTAIPQYNDVGSGKTFTLEQDAYVYYQIMVGTGTSVTSFVYPQLEAGSSATTFEPYTGGIPGPNPEYPQELVSIEQPVATVCGKNLWDKARGYKIEDWVMSLKQGSYSEIPIYVGKGNTVTCSYKQTLEMGLGFYVGFAKSREIEINDWLYHSTSQSLIRNSVTLTATQDTIYLRCSSASIENGNFMKYIGDDLQIEFGDTATSYEPYAGSSIILNHTLHGIPVTSGGNYTDSDGQQWICDDVDLERGVYVQRVLVQAFTGGESWTVNPLAESLGTIAYHTYNSNGDMEFAVGLCSHFINGGQWSSGLNSKTNVFWTANTTTAVFKTDGAQSLDDFVSFLRREYESGNPVTLYSVLRTPIETPLTAEEIETYKSIKTNYPNTTVLNNAGAHMKVKYNADTKLYINNAAVNGAATVVEEVLNDTY